MEAGWERKRLIPESKDVFQGRVVGDELVHRRIVWLEGGAYEDRVFTMPLDGSRPERQLSPDGSSVEWMSAADGVAVWSTLGEGFPEEHVARSVDGSGPGVRIQEGPSHSNVQVGEGFAAWMQTSSGVTVSTLDGQQQEVLRRGTFHVPCRLAVDDDRLAFVTRAGNRLALHVVGVDAD